jgi:protein TonB
LEGDVVVEVTIDERGEVTAAKLLQGIGRGIEDKVIAVVRTWKFRPATEDGMPIASRQDVRFHYPS